MYCAGARKPKDAGSKFWLNISVTLLFSARYGEETSDAGGRERHHDDNRHASEDGPSMCHLKLRPRF